MPRTREEIDAEIELLRAKLRAREGRPGLSQNVEDIRARIAACEAETAA